jgi:hypothetical protein
MAGTGERGPDEVSTRILSLLGALRGAERERLSTLRGSPERHAAEQRVDQLQRRLRDLASAVQVGGRES